MWNRWCGSAIKPLRKHCRARVARWQLIGINCWCRLSDYAPALVILIAFMAPTGGYGNNNQKQRLWLPQVVYLISQPQKLRPLRQRCRHCRKRPQLIWKHGMALAFALAYLEKQQLFCNCSDLLMGLCIAMKKAAICQPMGALPNSALHCAQAASAHAPLGPPVWKAWKFAAATNNANRFGCGSRSWLGVSFISKPYFTFQALPMALIGPYGANFPGKTSLNGWRHGNRA